MDDNKAFDPVKEFINLRDQLGKTLGVGIKSMTGSKSNFPALDIYETETMVIVHTQPLGGINKESIDVSVEDGVLTISGETASTLDIPDEAYIQREQNFGPFSRSIHIPRKIQAATAKATFKNSVLIIELPKE